MRDLKDVLNESRTNPKEIANYLESWVKQPADQKDMYIILGAITEGLQRGLAYREDPAYIDKMDDKYRKANEALKTFVGQLK